MSNITSIHHLDQEIVGDVVTLYGRLAKLKAQIDALDKASFGSISDDGKIGAIRNIFETAVRSGVLGREILRKIVKAHPALKLRRPEGGEPEDDWSDAELEAARLSLASEQDGIRSGHDSLPGDTPRE